MGLTTKTAETNLRRSLRNEAQTGAPPGQRQRTPPRLSIIVPCYNEELVIQGTAKRLTELLGDLTTAGKIAPESFICFIDNGSRDSTWEIVCALHRHDSMIKGLKLASNVGVQNGLLAGLLRVRGDADCVVSIDADLQQDERAIGAFLEKYEQGAHVVYGVRRNRATDSYLRRGTSAFFYNLMKIMRTKLVSNHSEYRLLSRQALDALSQYQEYNLFLRGVLVDMGLKSEVVFFDVRQRSAGSSKHTFGNLISLALEAITSSSVAPLRFVAIAGVLISGWSCLMTLFVLYHKLWKADTIPGWAAILIPIYFLGGVQIMFIGLVGEYIGKIYKETKARPRYIKEAELF